jgi:hypothetical protein
MGTKSSKVSAGVQVKAPIPAQIEAAAKKIHTESENFQKKLYSQRGYPGYAVIQWSDLKDGYYKSSIIKIATESLSKPKKAKR